MKLAFVQENQDRLQGIETNRHFCPFLSRNGGPVLGGLSTCVNALEVPPPGICEIEEMLTAIEIELIIDRRSDVNFIERRRNLSVNAFFAN